MTSQAPEIPRTERRGYGGVAVGPSPYERWIESLQVPIYRSYYLEDMRTIQLGRWEARDCDAAFLDLAGQQGISGAYVTEIAPGATLPPFKVAVEEAVYALQGRGITHVRPDTSVAARTFEWQPHSLFRIPANYTYQISNASGSQPARLLHYNYLPLAMSILGDPRFFFQSPVAEPEAADLYSRAVQHRSQGSGTAESYWEGNFFPDMRAWDQLDALTIRGAGGKAVHVQFPGSEISGHMSVFPPRTYKKAHRHGPGTVIVIPRGEGYSIMWLEGQEKVIIPWHEGSCFVPPMRWYHQHFNVSDVADRYLAIHRPASLRKMGWSGESEEEFVQQDQIEYPDEDPMVRDLFQKELGKRGLSSVMPDEAYKDRNYRFELMKGS